VTFDIDANGIIHVSAKDKATGKEQKTEIIAPQKMSKEELEKKMKAAEEYAAQDKEEFEKAELKNTADALVYSTDHTLREFKDRIPQEVQDKVEKAKTDLQEAIKKEDVAEMKDKTEKLNEAIKEIGANMYKDVGGNPEQEAGPGPGPEGEGPNPNENSGPSG
jgi:molecular chaperone DnaK